MKMNPKDEGNIKKTLPSPTTTIRNESGQLSIFLAVVLIIIITLLGFVINVGLFVKAKINLQNAVDAAAWSGAAVQSRQLTQIAYMNWEMRNNYKEWMLKYYVIGQRGIESTRANKRSKSGNMNFRVGTFSDDSPGHDKLNIPSICIHYGGVANICALYDVPGLPRFEVSALPGISEHHKAFVDALVSKKAQDCAERSSLNMGTAMLWAYGTGEDNTFSNTPQIAADRPGAWVNALELAMRVRNMEMMVNRPPVSEICSTGSNCTQVTELDQDNNDFPINERPIKAFMSGYKNLGGGAFKDAESETPDGFSASFKLTELAPSPFIDQNQKSLSNILIPDNAQYGNVPGNPKEKHYLDLRPYLLNLATFFTFFVPDDGTFKGTETNAGCNSSRTALPVPGFILGFEKNPSVLTYYAVKGEASFTGLFFPFTNTEGIKLKAYAAAKPYGGRIGPKLFGIQNGSSIVPREDDQHHSVPYVSGFDITNYRSAGPGGSTYKPGDPIPFNEEFWVSNNQPIGASPESTGEIRFAIPNLLYDFSDVGQLQAQVAAGFGRDSGIQKIRPKFSAALAYGNADEASGLYNAAQFDLFAQNLNAAGDLSPNDVKQAINNVRRPTLYEALNYLIPTQEFDGDDELDLVPMVKNNSDSGLTLSIFAPLYGPHTLYQNSAAIKEFASSYLDSNKPAIDQFLAALEFVANSIKTSAPSAREFQSFDLAAKSIYNAPLEDDNCQSMAGKFWQYFLAPIKKCGVTPLKDSFTEYISKQESKPGQTNYATIYNTYYFPATDEKTLRMLSAYRPGPRHGAGSDSEVNSPLVPENAPTKSKRNYYSTKFIALENVLSDSDTYERINPLFEYFSDGQMKNPTDLRDVNLRNLLPKGPIEQEFGKLTH